VPHLFHPVCIFTTSFLLFNTLLVASSYIVKLLLYVVLCKLIVTYKSFSTAIKHHCVCPLGIIRAHLGIGKCFVVIDGIKHVFGVVCYTSIQVKFYKEKDGAYVS
jgi:hypothetical protein